MEKWVSIHWWYVTTALIPVGLLPPHPKKKSLKLGLVCDEGMHCPRVRIPLAVCDSHVTVNLFDNSFTLAPQSQNPSNDPTPNGNDVSGMKLLYS